MFPGGEGGRCVGLTTLPFSYADYLEIWKPQIPGTLRACRGLLWDCFTFTFTVVVEVIADADIKIYFRQCPFKP